MANRNVKTTTTRAPSSTRLLNWYDKCRRTMPWRALPGASADPYKIWISEVMLQQTTVATVKPYFLKFIDRWPTVFALSAAPLEEVFQMWAGLGYYRRARLLHQCARLLVSRWGGKLPRLEADLLTLPGFGPYTAAAVAAIAFNVSTNVVDGNVERVVARVFGIANPLPKSKPELVAAAATLVPKTRGGDYAQALMDLGATICTPRAPRCAECPWAGTCCARADGNQEEFPKRLKRKAKPTRRSVAFVAFDMKGHVLLRPRDLKGLLGGMLGVDMSPWQEGEMPKPSEVVRYAPAKGKWEKAPTLVKHVFTHFVLEVCVCACVVKSRPPGQWIAVDRLDTGAVPTLMKKIIHRAQETV